jgi:hypothetical protein
MRRYVTLMLGILGTVLSMAARAEEAKPNSAKRTIVLTEGIVGGFVPPTVRFRAVFLELADGGLEVWTQQLQGESSTFHSGKLDAKLATSLFQEFDSADLWNLPREKPEGGDDIYGADTSLAVTSSGHSWRNGGPAGCVHEESSIHPNPQQKVTFQQLVARVKAAATGAARTSSDAKALEAALAKTR